MGFETNKKVEQILNQLFSHNMIPAINRPTRVARNTASAIDHFIRNTVTDTECKAGIIETDLSDHFAIIFALKTDENIFEKHSEHFVYKRLWRKINLFKRKLHETTWDNIKNIKESNERYRKFLETFSCIYESFFVRGELE